MKTFLSIIVIIPLLTGCKKPAYLIFDNQVPDATPIIFAADIFSRDSSYVGYSTFDQNTNEYYYAITNRYWNTSQILRLSANMQIDTVKLNIMSSWVGEPMFRPDNKRMYFTAIMPPDADQNWHADLFYVEKKGDGWSEPKRFELNTTASEWHVSFTDKNVAYFGSEKEGGRLKADIFYSKPENGEFKQAIKLPAGINTEYNDCDPLIAPDESYLIFHSDRPGGYGEHDLFITFRKEKDVWTEPVNMGRNINTSSWEMGPSLSHDGKYLFFTRRKSQDTKEPSKIFWVDMATIGKHKQ